MLTRSVWFIVLCFMLVYSQGFSQKTWTLKDCIAYALEHSLVQKTQNYSTKISKEHWQQSKRDMLPIINVSYPSYNVSFGRTLDPVTNSFVDTRFVSGISGGLASSIILFEAFKKWHILTYHKLIYQSSKFDTQQIQYDLAFRIMNLFNQILFQEGALQIIEEQQAANLLHYKVIAKKVELEMMAKADLFDIEATTSADALAVLRAENALKAAKLALIQEMNLEVDSIEIIQDITMEKQVISQTPFSTEQLFLASQETLPSLQKSKLSVEQAKKRLSITKTALFPRISLVGSLYTSYSDNIKDASGTTISFNDQIKNNQSKFIGLSLNFPIFNNGRIRSGIKVSKIELKKAQTQLEIEEQNTYKVIQELLQKNKALIAEEKLNENQLKAKGKAYAIAQKKFEKKLINLYELQIASQTYLQAKIVQVRLKAQKTIQKCTLDFYNGTFTLPTSHASN